MHDAYLTTRCPDCGQTLAVPADGLHASFTCPRCLAVRPGTDLISAETPLRAIPSDGADPASAPAAVERMVDRQDAPPSPGGGECERSRSALPLELADTVLMNSVEAPPPHRGVDVSAGTAPGESFARRATTTAVPSPDGTPLSLTRRLFAALRGPADVAVGLVIGMDSAVAGHRLHLLGGAVLAVLVAQWSSPMLYVVTLPGLAALAYLFLLAGLFSLRDERGAWTLRTVGDFAYAWLDAAVDDFLDLTELPRAEVGRRVGCWLASVGSVAVVVVSPAIGLSARYGTASQTVAGIGHVLPVIQGIGGGLVAAGIVLTVAAHLRRDRSDDRLDRVDLADGSEDARPAVMDLLAPGAETAIRKLAQPSLRSLLEVLRTWRPRRGRGRFDYQFSLRRHLERAFPGSSMDHRRGIATGGGRYVFPDVCLDDRLVIEVLPKVDGVGTELAVGRVLEYLEAWSGGPVVLLVAESRFDFASAPIARQVGALCERGHPVLCVAAGRRVQ
ncbi:MAG: hypothetical protein JW751_07745 [Polyangiaceae bacterium]|nr:hypothetical protein [Polyangiaceae bacterium]